MSSLLQRLSQLSQQQPLYATYEGGVSDRFGYYLANPHDFVLRTETKVEYHVQDCEVPRNARIALAAIVDARFFASEGGTLETIGDWDAQAWDVSHEDVGVSEEDLDRAWAIYHDAFRAALRLM
jgi:hypothetical protein